MKSNKLLASKNTKNKLMSLPIRTQKHPKRTPKKKKRNKLRFTKKINKFITNTQQVIWFLQIYIKKNYSKLK